MRKKVFLLLVFCLLCLTNVQAQDCPDSALKSSGTVRFRQPGETFEIPIQVPGCEPIVLDLRWSNGRSNGSNFNVTFLDGDNQAIHTRQLSGFLTGNYQFPFATLEPRPWYGSGSMLALPTTVSIQAIQPFALPATLSYTLTRIGVRAKGRQAGPTEERDKQGSVVEPGKPGNEIVKIRSAVRLIGSSRVPLVQIHLKTARPFPVRDSALQLRIGKRVLINELSGDHTGRVLTVSLTPEMFSELEDGAEIVAFFGDSESGGLATRDDWNFGRLDKALLK